MAIFVCLKRPLSGSSTVEYCISHCSTTLGLSAILQ
eukprot:IDg11623t1